MTEILGRCSDCGEDIVLHPHELTLHVRPAGGCPATCTFTCPSCHAPQRRILTDDKFAELATAGVVVRAVPAALTDDDLTALKQALLLTDDLSDLAATEPR